MTARSFSLIFLVILSVLQQDLIGQTYVSDGDDLQTFVNAAAPGEVFIVSNGTYNDFEATFTARATKEAPIYIKAETVGGVTLTGESHFVFKKAAHIILDGFVFDAKDDNTLVKLEGSQYIRITRNVFELETTESIKWVFIGGFWNDYSFQYLSHHNRVDHNIFKNKNTPGHYITIDGTSNEDQTDIRQSQYDRIDHNYFYNNSPRAANEQESIRIGWSEMSMSSGYTIVEHNLFEECDGDPEIISVKSCDNIIRHNTFRRSHGTLSLRHGNRNRVEGNYFFGGGKPNATFVNSNGSTSTIHTGGIRIYGTDHLIINNYMEGLQGTRWDAPIALTQGDAIDGSSTNLSQHFRAERCTLAFNTLVDNTYGIEIGFDNNGNYNKALKDIVIANNLILGASNSLVAYMDGNIPSGEISWYNNVLYPMGNASLTSDGSVFANAEVQIIDPALSVVDSLWRTTNSSPRMPAGVASLQIVQDIDGQSRPDSSTVGADHYSLETVLYPPLSPADVGPQASTVATSIDDLDRPKPSFRLYPNPASNQLSIDRIPEKMNQLKIYSLKGDLVKHYQLTPNTTDKLSLELGSLSGGVYWVQLIGEQAIYTQKMVISGP